MTELSKTYDPKSVEASTYARWEQSGVFHDEPDPARPPFIIAMPPPNVTGRAHLGHGSTYTPMDVLVRYHRMLGENANWLPGLDHAAIATEAVLVRELKLEGASRESLGREAYLRRAWEWSRESGETINAQFRALGFAPDWERARFTMDAHLSASVRKVFVQLYREGLIYRGTRLINWDPKGQTTVSDAEVEHVERDAHLWKIRYPFTRDDLTTGIEVATTRPETMLGDVAIAVHPEDERYAKLIGRTVLLPPLLERAIPIIADECVERDFGTGAVKVTPAHDATDYEIGVRHNLPMLSVIDFSAAITGADISVGTYAGLDRNEARKRIVADLRTTNLLVAEEAYRHAIAVSERTGDVIEPLLSLQWFLTMAPLAQPALQAYREKRLRFVPERYGRTYETWLENIRDWNISRQVWWGHQLPVWYTPAGDVVVAESEEEAAELAHRKHGTRELTRDPDTLDTWFSSALWPFSILGWPEKTPELAHWYPSSVLVTGWEIIFLWVSRMVMLGLHFMDALPFPEVFVAPLVFDAQGRKMSKSLGNAIDPMDIIERFGADAFRMGVLRQMRLEGQEVRFHESRCEEARNFNTKIWNAARYLQSLPEGLPTARTLANPHDLALADRWVLTRLHDTIGEMSAHLNAYDFGNAAETIWRFIWYEFCDWYLEASKIATPTRAAVLSFVMNNAMRLLHPLEPFISETVWLALPHDGATIVTASWPDPDEVPVDREAAAAFDAVRATVERVRNLRSEMALPPRERLVIDVPANIPAEASALLATLSIATCETIPSAGATWVEALASVQGRAPEALLSERARKDVVRLRAEIERSEKKLANPDFTAKAAPDVVAKERAKLAAYREDLERVEVALSSLEG